MGIDSVAAFVDAVRQSRLLEPETLDELARRAPGHFSDPRALAHHLIQKGRLTAYQVNQLFQGQGKTLVLGNYILLERLGEGGMGQVFKAKHRSMGRVVALKVIRRDRLENAEAVKRFRREIQAVAQLHHANVVLAFDADAVGNTHFFVMEYVNGIDLSQMVKEKGALQVGTACDFIRQSALGLAHAHSKGLVHRDIKPSNLLVTNEEGSVNGKGKAKGPGRALVKILDMGLARLSPQDSEDSTGMSLSQDGAVVGTPDFMAPEQAKNSSKVDSRADIYSLGCTFYYLLTRQAPFVGGTNIEKLLKHQMDTPRPVEQFRSDVPEPVRVLLLRMLAKRPEDRVQTADEVATILTPFCDGSGSLGGAVGSTATMPAIPTAAPTLPLAGAITPTAASRPSRKLPVLAGNVRQRWRGLAIAGAVASVLLLGVGFLLVKALFGSSAGKPNSSGQLVSVKNFTPRQTQGTTKRPPPSGEPGHKFLPDDTALVISYHLAQLLQSPVVNPPVRDELEKKLEPQKVLLSLAGINLFRDVKRVTLAVSPGQTNKHSFVFQGDFNAERFRAGTEEHRSIFKARTVQGLPDARMLEFQDPTSKQHYYFALVSPTALILSTDREHVINCFHRAAGRRAPKLSDEALHGLVQNLDSRPTLYLVMGNGFLSQLLGETTGRFNLPIRYIHGGLRFGNDVVAEAVAGASNSEALEPLGNSLRFLLGRAMKDLGDNAMLTALVRELTNEVPVVNKRDMTVTLRHTFPAEEFRRLMLAKEMPKKKDFSEKP